MDCNNCTKLFKMISLLNDNIASILSGYELLVNIVNNHETELVQIKSNLTKEEKSIQIIPDAISSVSCESVLSSVKIPVAENVDVLSLSNVEIVDKDMFLNEQQLDEISPQSSTPKPTHVTEKYNVDNTSLGDFSDISEISSVSDGEKTVSNNTTTTSTSVTSENSQYQVPDCNLDYLAYEVHDSQLFNLFEVTKLEDSTIFTHSFNNRSAAYYGMHPYQYGSTFHIARDFSENPYLVKILNYVEIVYPRFKFNSAMVHRYKSGEDFIPHHSDDEEDIEDNSLIVTISLGCSRTFEFKEVGKSECGDKLRLHHGDSLVMTKKSQKYFTHGIPRENLSGKRLSITLRLIKPRKYPADQKEVGTQTMGCDTQTVQTVLNPLRNQPDALLIDGYQPMATEGEHAPFDDHNVKSTSVAVITNDQYDVCNKDGYQTTQDYPIRNGMRSRKPYNNAFIPQPNEGIDTLYISSSMFRHLDPSRLSSPKQKAEVLFYPGADALQMSRRLMQDLRHLSIDKGKVKKVFVMVGTNNVDRIFDGSCPLPQAEADINDMLYKLWSLFGNAQLYVINILPRQNHSKNSVVQSLNCFIEQLCKVHGLTFINTETSENHFFSDNNGIRYYDLFMGGYDNVHLNNRGYAVMAKMLKYMAHT